MGNKINVLLVQTGMVPRAAEMDNTPAAMQQALGGKIQIWKPFYDNVALICRQDAKRMGLPINRTFYNEIDEMVQAFAGDFLICGREGEQFTSLTAGQIEKYTDEFKDPQRLAILGRKLATPPVSRFQPKPKPPGPWDTYRIYQVKPVPRDFGGYDLRRDVAFAGLDSLKLRGLKVDPANYELAYTGALEAGMTPETLFHKFNLDIPPDFHGHSMSVSDVVMFVRKGRETAYFCDSIGFKS